MKHKMLSSLICCVIGMTAVSCDVQAGNLDVYRNLLAKNTYTIRYENITPLPRITNRDKAPLYGSSGLAVNKADYLTNRQFTGIVVGNGADKYEEVSDGVIAMCRLLKNNESFIFTKQQSNGAFEFFGDKKGTVKAVKRNILAEIFGGQSYGDSEMTKLLNAILPASAKSADAPQYQYVGSGTLGNGLNYEDYKANTDGKMEAVRYYFNGATLVKISSATCFRKQNGELDGYKCIVKINEFSPNPDMKLLKLPEGLQDTTKRNGED